MKVNYKLRLILSVALIAGTMGIISCDDDDKPGAGVSFALTEQDEPESAGLVEVDINLDRALTEDVVVSYTLSGSADENDDYTIEPAGGSITIPAGMTFATFEIDVIDDGVAENEERVVISLTSVSGPAQIKQGSNVFTLTLEDTGLPKAVISFTEEQSVPLESDGYFEILLSMDRPLEAAVELAYSLDGSAVEGEDYVLLNANANGNIVIEAGATEAVIEVGIEPDTDFEVDFENQISYETILVTLTSVVSGPGQINSTKDEHLVGIFEDDMLVGLTWDNGTGVVGDVDLDLFAWIDRPSTATEDFTWISAALSHDVEDSVHAITIPAEYVDAKFGLSIVYYSGSSDNVTATVDFFNFGGTVNATTDIEGEADDVESREAVYGTVNKNPYTWAYLTNPESDEEPPVAIVLTMEKEGVHYVNVSDITVPASGSRIKYPGVSPGAKDVPLLREGRVMQTVKIPKDFFKNHEWTGKRRLIKK